MHPERPDFDASPLTPVVSLHKEDGVSHGTIGGLVSGAGPSVVAKGVFLGSALEVIESTSSLDLSLSASSNTGRIHKRTEVHHSRSSLGVPPAAVQEEDIELTILHPERLSIDIIPNSSEPFQGPGDGVVGPSLPTSIAPSVRFEEETNSTAPVLSPAEKAHRVRRGRLHFAALCWVLFLEGWNDGSTGPLLPTVQRFYNVMCPVFSICILFLIDLADVDWICNRVPPFRLQYSCMCPASTGPIISSCAYLAF